MNNEPEKASVVAPDPTKPDQGEVVSSASRMFDSAMQATSQVASAAAEFGKSARKKVAGATEATGKAVGAAAVEIGDLNGDGKIDAEDAKIAAGKAKEVAVAAGTVVGEVAKDLPKHDMVKDAAAGAAIGAVVAVPLPVIGPVMGAALGAVAGVARNLMRGKK